MTTTPPTSAQKPSALSAPPPAGAVSVAAGGAPTAGSLGGAVNAYLARVKGGDIGALPAVLGIIALCIVFASLRPVFFTPGNFANLLTQGAAVTVIAMGLVFVLLLGEIDLSAGVTSGVCGAVLAVVMTRQGAPLAVGLPISVLTGTVIGLAIGVLVSYVRIPSFIVTLAAFLAFQGAVLIIIGEGGNVPVRDTVVLSIANNNLSALLGWVLVVGSVGLYGAVQVARTLRRRSTGLAADPWSLVAIRVGGLLVLAAAAVYVLNQERSRNPFVISLKGVPLVVPLMLALYVVLTFVLDKTTYGRHIYAVGGNTEAARRAGIRVQIIRVSVFVIASTLASIGGIIAASRANSVDPNAGGSNVLLYAVGAAVIGGTSLYGGRGRVRDAILGGAVVAIIDNGMGLLGYSAGVKFVVTGLVLLIAAGVDALSRRRAQASGRG
jgi:D-xylose transport system permease protein